MKLASSLLFLLPGAYSLSAVPKKSNAVDRRAFIGSAAAALITVAPMASFAEGESFDDLAMPNADDVKKQSEAEIAARLKKKAELQKKATRPMNFKESMSREGEIQQSLKKSQQEKRNAMCEELGRGC